MRTRKCALVVGVLLFLPTATAAQEGGELGNELYRSFILPLLGGTAGLLMLLLVAVILSLALRSRRH